MAIELYPWFKEIEKGVKKNNLKKDMSELLKNSTSSGRTDAILVCFNKWSRFLVYTRTVYDEGKNDFDASKFYYPDNDIEWIIPKVDREKVRLPDKYK